MAVQPTQSKRDFVIRSAMPRDLSRLTGIGETILAGGRLSKRALRSLLHSKSAAVSIAETAPKPRPGRRRPSQLDFGFMEGKPEVESTLLGCAALLFRRGSATARLHHLSVAAGRKDVAKALLAAIEATAGERGALTLRSRVGRDKPSALKLHERQGYLRSTPAMRAAGSPLSRGGAETRTVSTAAGHASTGDELDAGAGAIAFAKSLIPPSVGPPRRVPYYAQTTDFTCGPAALMMGLAALGDPSPLNREREFGFWREATSIYLISAPGGCEPYGLAVAAARQGFKPSIHVSEEGPYFIEARKGDARRDIMLEAQRIFRKEAERLAIPVDRKSISSSGLKQALDGGAAAIVLVSCKRLTGDRTPHWILAYAADGHRIYAHDPWLDAAARHPRGSEAMAIPIPEFERMAVWGRSRLRAAVVVKR